MYREGLREILKNLLAEYNLPSSVISLKIGKADNYLTKFIRGTTRDIAPDDLYQIIQQIDPKLKVSDIYRLIEQKKTSLIFSKN